MNRKLTILIVAGCALLATAAANAETPAMYWGIGFSNTAYTTRPFTDPGDPANNVTAELESRGYALKAGIDIGSWLGLEFQYDLAKEGKDQPYNLGNKLEINAGSAFARFNFPFPRVNLYALAGIGRVSIDTGPQTARENHYAAGLGLDLMASDRNMLYVEALRYQHEDLEDNDPYMVVYTVGFKHHFEFAGVR